MNKIIEIPKGFRQDKRGALVPETIIKPINIDRDNLVNELVSEALSVNHLIAVLKRFSLQRISEFIELSAMDYDTRIGGEKGNVTLVSFNGQYKVIRQLSDSIYFDERLEIAKQLIDECISEWVEGSNVEIKALINRAFATHRGQVSTGRILELRQLKFDHPKWQEAMKAIADSININDTVTYVRFYERIGMTDQYKIIPLDISSVSVFTDEKTAGKDVQNGEGFEYAS
jgi:hypothetical protein